VGGDGWVVGGKGEAYAGRVGAVALVAGGAFADNAAVGVAGKGEGLLVGGSQGDKGGGGDGGVWELGRGFTACRPR